MNDYDWNPSFLDFAYEDEDGPWLDAFEDHSKHPYLHLYYEYGSHRKNIVAQLSQTLMRSTNDEFKGVVGDCILHSTGYDHNDLRFCDAYSHESKDSTNPMLHAPPASRITNPHETR